MPFPVVLLAASFACQGPGAPEAGPDAWCDDEAPTGVVVVPYCDDAAPAEGEGQADDWMLANPWVRVVIRAPIAALSLAGLGGGTVIDASPWGWQDRLHEIAPLVDDGWLDVDTFETDAQGVTVEGRVVALPDRPLPDEGQRRTVRWWLSPDDPFLHLDGADGAWIHASGAFERLGSALVHESLTLGWDGAVAEDLGGAIRLTGTTALLAAPTRDATTWLYPDGALVSGIAPGAQQIVLLDQGIPVARIKVEDDGIFEGRAPPEVDGVRAEAEGHAPSPVVPPGADLELPVGASGTLVLPTRWRGAPARPFRIDWTDDAGRAGTSWLPEHGGGITLGAGTFTLTASAGPTVDPVTRRVAVADEETVRVPVTFTGFDPGDRVLADFAAEVDRSRTWRAGEDADALRAHLLAGIGFVVAAPQDDVPTAEPYEEDAPWIRARNGATLTGDAFTITSWPWSVDDDESGHGVQAPRLVPDAVDALSAVWGGPSTRRATIVDAGWLALAPAPWSVQPTPTGALLPDPIGGPAAWSDWFTWLDAAQPVAPVGPLTWAEVLDPRAFLAVEVEGALLGGRVVATTGPLLVLDAQGRRPGDLLPGPATDLRVHLAVDDRSAQLTNLAILGEGGRVLAESEMTGVRGTLDASISDPGRWLVGAAWSDDGRTWAVTGPIWARSPAFDPEPR